MNIPNIIMGSVMMCIGALIILFQIKGFKGGMKDRWGYQRALLIAGIGFVVIGAMIITENL